MSLARLEHLPQEDQAFWRVGKLRFRFGLKVTFVWSFLVVFSKSSDFLSANPRRKRAYISPYGYEDQLLRPFKVSFGVMFKGTGGEQALRLPDFHRHEQ